jgi:D-glycero-alpha-D-manno-heptose-7-phosphate kinase
MADVEAGTGMGSSSSFTVALINALYLLRHEVASRHCIAEHACHIEIDQVGKRIGKQDQYIASYGGVQQLKIFKNGRTEVNPVPLSTEFISELERRFILFYTNIRRPAGLILDSQTENIRKKDNQVSDRMHRIKEMGHKIKFALQSENIDDIGYIFHEHWQEKRQISPDMSSQAIDEWYKLGLKSGAIGGKVVGAGGGGFILFVSKEDKRKELIHTMVNAGMRFMNFRFDFDGVKIMINL